MSTAIQFHTDRSFACYGLLCKLLTENENDYHYEHFLEALIDEDGSHVHGCGCELCIGLKVAQKLPDSFSRFLSYYRLLHSENYLASMMLNNIDITRLIISRYYQMVSISD